MTVKTFRHRPPHQWTRVTIKVVPRMTDAVAAFLAGLTGSGVEIAAAGETGYEKVIGYLAAPENREPPLPAPEAKTAQLRSFLTDLRQFFQETPPLLSLDDIQEEDWGEEWKKNFTTFRITPRLLIKPSWETYTPGNQPPGAGEAVIELDPGLAFGTGHHASTRLALELLDSIYRAAEPRPARVLDVGTGTGILSMACALFGAREVTAVDKDLDAVATARDNIRRNGLEKIITISGEDIAGLVNSFDLIVANITHDILINLAPVIVRLLSTGQPGRQARLIISGILKGEQAESIKTTYGNRGLACTALETAEEWAALLFCRKADPGCRYISGLSL